MYAIITVIGKDKMGILSAVCTFLADKNVNIEDISQTVLQGDFIMIMRVDVSASTLPLADLAVAIAEEGQALGVDIALRHEDIFNAMHKI